MLTDIYPAGETPIPGRDGGRAGGVGARAARGPVHVVTSLDALPNAVASLAREGDLRRHDGCGVDRQRRRPDSGAPSVERTGGRMQQ